MTIDPCVRLSVASRDGARLTVCPHGGHVLGWAPAGGPERLWLSEATRCGPGEAIRGGIPVIFPQFSGQEIPGQRIHGSGPVPRHGLARTRAWELDGVGRSLDGAAEATMTLRSDPDTVVRWPAEFVLTLKARASGRTLEVNLTVHNDGADPFSFAAALHTYLRVSDSTRAVLHGLSGHRAEDQGAGPEAMGGGEHTRTLPEGTHPAAGPQDLAVRDVSGPVVLEDEKLGRLQLDAVGFPDRVVWNPGPDAVPSDVHPGGEREFVCVEPAALHPMMLVPGGSWNGRQVLQALR